jgi:hypothetical protein
VIQRIWIWGPQSYLAVNTCWDAVPGGMPHCFQTPPCSLPPCGGEEAVESHMIQRVQSQCPQNGLVANPLWDAFPGGSPSWWEEVDEIM